MEKTSGKDNHETKPGEMYDVSGSVRHKTKRGEIDDNAVVAAIATALFEVTIDVHDIEPAVLTIKKVTHSPWGSKIHGIREIPRK